MINLTLSDSIIKKFITNLLLLHFELIRIIKVDFLKCVFMCLFV